MTVHEPVEIGGPWTVTGGGCPFGLIIPKERVYISEVKSAVLAQKMLQQAK